MICVGLGLGALAACFRLLAEIDILDVGANRLDVLFQRRGLGLQILTKRGSNWVDA